MAAMSSSSLRTKFRQAWSLGDYLRDCRLELARRYLAQGTACSRRRGCRAISTPPIFLPPFARRYGHYPGEARHLLIPVIHPVIHGPVDQSSTVVMRFVTAHISCHCA
jgi:AraC-like DNA-binding protein